MAAAVNGSIVAPRSARVRVASRLRAARRLPIIPMFLLSLVVVAGVAAPWISPHDPLDDDLRARNRPPAWVGDFSAAFVVDVLYAYIDPRIRYG